MMKDFAALIASNKGRMVAAFTAFVMGGITQFITSKGLNLPGELAVAISGMMAALCGWFLDNMAARLNNRGITAIQDALPNVPPTGRANPGMVAAVERLVERTGEDPAEKTQFRALTIDEAREIRTRIFDLGRARPDLVAEIRKALDALRTEIIDAPPRKR